MIKKGLAHNETVFEQFFWEEYFIFSNLVKKLNFNGDLLYSLRQKCVTPPKIMLVVSITQKFL